MAIPKTTHGRDPFECISALQKCIRRGEERQAMLFALELAKTSKGFCTMLLNRLRVIAHEDVGLANIEVVNFVMLTCDMIVYDKPPWRMAIGNVVRALARSVKSREADHFQIVTNTQLLKEGPGPVPDCALDKHTRHGKKLGRGFEHFITEGSKIVPPVEKKDPYYDEWAAILRGHDKLGTKLDDAPKETNGTLF